MTALESKIKRNIVFGSLFIPAQAKRAAEVQRAKALARNTCKRGHEYTEENTYYAPGRNKNGKVERACKICLRNRPSQRNQKRSV